jgi:hypothetical protein
MLNLLTLPNHHLLVDVVVKQTQQGQALFAPSSQAVGPVVATSAPQEKPSLFYEGMCPCCRYCDQYFVHRIYIRSNSYNTCDYRIVRIVVIACESLQQTPFIAH